MPLLLLELKVMQSRPLKAMQHRLDWALSRLAAVQKKLSSSAM
jgi:hypothetical protein